MWNAIIASVNAELLAAGLVDVLGNPLTVLVGPEWLMQENAPPRLVMVYDVDGFDDASDVGLNPRPLYDCWAGGTLHVWGADFDSTRSLAFGLVASFRRALQRSGAAFKAIRAAWNNVTRDVHLGREYMVQMAARVPILDEALAYAPSSTVTANHTGWMDFPKGGDPPGTPVEAC